MNTSPSSPDTPPEAKAPRPMREALLTYGVVFLIVLALALLSQVIGLVSDYLYLLVCATFIGVPHLLMQRRKLDPEAFGLSTRQLGRNVAIGLGVSALTVLPFIGGQYIWETQARHTRYDFSVENWYAWPAEWEGEPKRWGDEPGAWVWLEEDGVHFGLRSKEQVRGALIVEADRPFIPQMIGDGVMIQAIDERGNPRAEVMPARRWELKPTLYFRRTHSILATPHGEDAAQVPRGLRLKTRRADGYEEEGLPLYFGPLGELQEQGEEGATLERGLWWMLLWLITQIFFIALPEEYFYRGYLLTRLGEAFAQRGTRGWWILTPQNLVTSLLFGVGHLLVPVGGVLLANRFTVFFPSLLFGLLRERTGTITASVVYHASCNMMVLIWVVHYH